MAGPASTRQTGITILAVLAAIGGVFSLLGGFVTVFAGGVVSTVSGSFGGIVIILGLILLALALVELFLAYGFWTLKSWAWSLGLLLEGANVILTAIQFLVGGATAVTLLVTIVVAGIILYYLNTPDVRKAFGAPETGFPMMLGR